MSLTDFLRQTTGPGDATVAHPLTQPPEPDAPVEATLRRLERDARRACPGMPPPPDWPAAVWAARLTYGLAQALAYRELGADFVAALLAVPCPALPSPPACYSVDLSFCLLPDLHRLAAALASDDPLTLALATLGRAWPLSSLGMAGLNDLDVSVFFDDDALRGLYVDRVIRRGDVGRLRDARVAAAVSAALGAHRSLAPVVRLALETPAGKST